MSLFVPTPLEPAWRSVLQRLHGRTLEDATLGLLVERLSRRYNGEEVSLARADELLARARFFFPRDVHKTALPAAELIRARATTPRPIRVVDLGAGMGAASVGLLRTWQHAKAKGELVPSIARVDAFDHDADALTVFEQIARHAAAEQLLPSFTLKTHVTSLEPERLARVSSGPCDVIVASNVLIEMLRALPLPKEQERGEALATILHDWMRSLSLARDGVCIVIEPALRESARVLQHARNALIARGHGVFAPCIHTATCPMLLRERDWCHEDLPVDLPSWLVPVARHAGLRWQGLTFSYLVVTPEPGRTVLNAMTLTPGRVPLRMVSAPRPSKGKTEAFVCGAEGERTLDTRVMQLERDARKHEPGECIDSLSRGDLLSVDAAALSSARRGDTWKVESVRDVLSAWDVESGSH